MQKASAVQRGSADESAGGEGAVPPGEEAAAPEPPPPTASLAALLEAVGWSEVKAINAINKASHTAYKKSELETLEPEDWAAGLQLVRGGK